MLADLGKWILGLVFPNECGGCRAPLGGVQDPVCKPCASAIRLIAPPHCVRCGRTSRAAIPCGKCGNERFHFDRAYACVFYDGKARELLHAYKFNRRKPLRRFFSNLLSDFHDAFLKQERFDAVLAVPLDRKRQNERGFNQSRLLSSALAKKLLIPDYSARLVRTRASAPQSSRLKSQRKMNVEDCFLVQNRDGLGSKQLLLVDDILTTGQTASECARVLKAAGAASVTVLACARGL